MSYYAIQGVESDTTAFGKFDTADEGWSYIDQHLAPRSDEFFVVEVTYQEVPRPNPEVFYSVMAPDGFLYGTSNRYQTPETALEHIQPYPGVTTVKVTIEPC